MSRLKPKSQPRPRLSRHQWSQHRRKKSKSKRPNLKLPRKFRRRKLQKLRRELSEGGDHPYVELGLPRRRKKRQRRAKQKLRQRRRPRQLLSRHPQENDLRRKVQPHGLLSPPRYQLSRHPRADKRADVLGRPLCADFVAEVAEEGGRLCLGAEHEP